MKNIVFSTAKTIRNKWSSFKNSKIGKILLGNTFNYIISLSSVGLMLSGLITPISPIIILFAAITLFGIVAHSVSETLKIRKLRKLHQESNLLLQHRKAKSQQDYILNLFPELNQVLELQIPKIKTKENKYNVNSKISMTKNIATVTTKAIVPVFYLSNAIIEATSGNVLSILKATGYGITSSTSLINTTLTEKEVEDLKTIFKSAINEEYNKSDTPNYNNLKDLKISAEGQIIQTLALKALLQHPNFFKLNDEKKRKYFNEIKEKYREIGNFYKPLTNLELEFFALKKQDVEESIFKNYLKDLKESLNPFYKIPKLEEKDELTKSLAQNIAFKAVGGTENNVVDVRTTKITKQATTKIR